MARPSMAEERRGQIIDATHQTMARFGVSGTTLDRIADAAGMSRGHIRHFVGNRDELFRDAAQALFLSPEGEPAILPADVESLADALDYLFGEEFTTSDSENAMVLGFVELSRSHADVAAVLARAYGGTWNRLHELVALAYPDVGEEVCTAITDVTLSTSLGIVFMGDFDPDPLRTTRTRTAVDALIASMVR